MLSNCRNYISIVMLVLAAIVVSAPLAFAHGEQINVGNNRASGPVSLTSAQIKALGLQTEMADMRPIARLLGVNGAVATLPDAQANVSLRISGNVNAVYVNLGDAVRKGQKLALVMARAVGNPPPTVAARAPIDGIIDARNIIVGQSVGPDTALFHLSNRRRMLVIGNVYEEDLGLVKVGQAAKVSLLAYPDKTFSGTVSFIGTMLDPDTRTVALWVLLDNPDNLLKPNLFARADIVLGQKEAALTVANAAVLEANGDKFVFIRDGDNYDRIEVGTGTEDSQYTEITSGLVPGDEVVTQGAREIYTLWLTGGKLEAEE